MLTAVGALEFKAQLNSSKVNQPLGQLVRVNKMLPQANPVQFVTKSSRVKRLPALKLGQQREGSRISQSLGSPDSAKLSQHLLSYVALVGKLGGPSTLRQPLAKEVFCFRVMMN
jgi:hypothetical protein